MLDLRNVARTLRTPLTRRPQRSAFTLIELLVVIAIIALLISILLPSLARARSLARLTLSMSNNRQIGQAYLIYRTDYKEQLPMVIDGAGNAPGWCTWSYGGKATNIRWAGKYGGIFDRPPGKRPVNQYVYPEITLAKTLPDVATRNQVEMPVFKSPGDSGSFQYSTPYPTKDLISSYDDVGTSYHNNMAWFDTLNAWMNSHGQGQKAGETLFAFWNRILQLGMKRMNTAANFAPSKFVWIHDQTGDIVAHDPQLRNWKGEFDDMNKSVMTFLDGHTDYVLMTPGAEMTKDYYFYMPMPGQAAP
ncbi:hypothetical protein BH11PLA1_BH11PLA1_10730 [soil metagenome]